VDQQDGHGLASRGLPPSQPSADPFQAGRPPGHMGVETVARCVAGTTREGPRRVRPLHLARFRCARAQGGTAGLLGRKVDQLITQKSRCLVQQRSTATHAIHGEFVVVPAVSADG
jgi:hypothetical protein